MKWLELSVRTTPEYVEPLTELFRRYGEGGAVVQEEGNWDPDNAPGAQGPPTSVVVMTYLPLDATAHGRRGMIDVGVRLISYIQPMEGLRERVLEEEEWETAWKSHFTLLRVGKCLVIKPTWQSYSPKDEETVIELDPGMAFGTGHHPTTRMCLEELERRMVPGMHVLDLGTGSGILAIAAAKLGAARVVALDVDALAVSTARDNARQNGVAGKVRCFQGTLPHRNAPSQRFDLVAANITAKAIVSAVPYAAEVLAPDGVMIASGIIRERQPEVEKALEKVLVILDRRSEGDWTTIVAGRTS